MESKMYYFVVPNIDFWFILLITGRSVLKSNLRFKNWNGVKAELFFLLLVKYEFAEF